MKDNIKGFCVNQNNCLNDEIVLLTSKYFKKSSLFYQLHHRARSPDGYTLKEDNSIVAPEEYSNSRKKKNEIRNQPLPIQIASRLLFGNENVKYYIKCFF